MKHHHLENGPSDTKGSWPFFVTLSSRLVQMSQAPWELCSLAWTSVGLMRTNGLPFCWGGLTPTPCVVNWSTSGRMYILLLMAGGLLLPVGWVFPKQSWHWGLLEQEWKQLPCAVKSGSESGCISLTPSRLSMSTLHCVLDVPKMLLTKALTKVVMIYD